MVSASRSCGWLPVGLWASGNAGKPCCRPAVQLGKGREGGDGIGGHIQVSLDSVRFTPWVEGVPCTVYNKHPLISAHPRFRPVWKVLGESHTWGLGGTSFLTNS